MSLANAAEVMREAVKKHSTWYLVQSSHDLRGAHLGCSILCCIDGSRSLRWLALHHQRVLQPIGLIDAHDVPHFWLQLLTSDAVQGDGPAFPASWQHRWELNSRSRGGAFSLILLLTVLFTAEGASKVIFSLTMRPLPGWGWVFASGMIGVLLAFYLGRKVRRSGCLACSLASSSSARA
jgi:hypothetical protein